MHTFHTYMYHYSCALFLNRYQQGDSRVVDDKGWVIGVELANIGVKDIIHYIFRLLGRDHEHNRPDRDQYVTIRWENILAG